MYKPKFYLVLALSLMAGTAFAQFQDPRPPAAIAEEKARQLRANQPMSKFDASQAVAYEIVSRSGIPGMIWIVAKNADTFEKRAHTALKAAEDLYNETNSPLVRVFLVTVPERADMGEFYQAVATYEAVKRTWRVVAYDGPAIPEWRVEITREWLYETERAGGAAKVNVAALQDKLGRQFNIQPSYVVPVGHTEIKMVPYIK